MEIPISGLNDPQPKFNTVTKSMRLLEHCITDLRSAKAVIAILKEQDPRIDTIQVPIHVFHELRKELTAKMYPQWYQGQRLVIILEVRIRPLDTAQADT